MGTWIEDSTEEFGKSVATSKLETKVRSDYEITGFMRDWILIVRPFQKILGEHADAMVSAGVMTREEANAWLNMHWEFVGAKPARVAGGAAIVCYGRERQTRAVVHIKTEALVGYERIRLKAETFISARSGAGEDERDLDNLSIAGISERRAEAAKNQGEAPPGPEDPSEDTGAMPDDDDFPFGHFEADEVSPGSDTRGYDVGELWVRVDFDDEFYESVIEAWGMKKEQLEEQRLQMAEDASEIAREKELQLNPKADNPFRKSDAEQVDTDTFNRKGASCALWRKRVENWGRDLTWNAEGPDNQTLKPHVPGDTSGLTLGKGWDAKNRTPKQIISETREAGLSKGDAEALSMFGDPDGRKSAATGLVGQQAKDALKAIKGVKLTKEQQAKLFGITYKQERDEAYRLYRNCKSPKDPAWKDLHPAIRAVWTDLKYVGHNTPLSRKKILPAVRKNDVKGLLKAMSDEKFWTKGHKGLAPTAPDRFTRRVTYLRSVIRTEKTLPFVCKH